MLELLSEDKLRSLAYYEVRCEFYDIWNKLFLNKNQIDKAILRKYGRFWPLVKAISMTRFRNLWFVPKFAGSILSHELILRSNQLWMQRCWEYPWAVLNSHLELDTHVLDVGSGWSLFPLYLAQNCNHVDSIDTDEQQMEVICPSLSDILKVKVNYHVDDVLNLSADDDTYDYVYCISVLEHLEEEIENGIIINKHTQKLERTAIRELIRVVKPGGKVIITLDYGNPDTSPRSFYFDYVKNLIGEFGEYFYESAINLNKIRITREKENTMRKLNTEFFPYDPGSPPNIPLGLVFTKH
jgi:ubiquinone/menaquinone biosynthesis C-methylase UbiE